MSAIHRGLRESRKAKQLAAAAAPGAAPDKSKHSTSRSRRDPDWVAPTFKIKKGKKDITDKGPQPKSRSFRFNDPTEGFGKKSLVWRFKHGDLKHKILDLAAKESPSTKGGIMSKSDFEKSFHQSNALDEPRFKKSGKKSAPAKSAPAKPPPRQDEGRFAQKDKNLFSRRDDNRSGRKDQDRFTQKDNDRPSRTGQDRFTPRERDGDRFPRKDQDRFARRDDDRPNRKGQDRFTQREEDRFSRKDQGRFSREDKPAYVSRDSNRFPQDGQQPSRGDHFNDSKQTTSEYASKSPRAQQKTEDDMANIARPSPDDAVGSSRFPWETGDERFAKRRFDGNGKDDGPVRIHHTTAASQFLYGRSVVEAVLKNTGRKLYRLYLYNGNDRQNLSQDAFLEMLARRQNIQVIKVGRDGLRMLDKMSEGRPHNGCVIEASPLPQLPLKSLGPLSEDPAKPGYTVELGWQSSEEAEINGTSNFVSHQLPKGRQPFVLLLDEILDPGNLGAILRSAAFLGANAVAVTKYGSATLTPVALKASAGGAESLTLFSVNNTIDFIMRSKEAGWLICAAVPDPARSRSRGNSHLTLDRVESYDLLATQPTVLVVGSEGEGLSKQVRRGAD